MSAKEKLMVELRKALTYADRDIEPIANSLLAAGFVLPETPKVDPVREEVDRLCNLAYDRDMSKLCKEDREVMLRLAADSLARQCDAYLAGCRDRCACDCVACIGIGCNEKWANSPHTCGDLQRAAMKRFGQTTE